MLAKPFLTVGALQLRSYPKTWYVVYPNTWNYEQGFQGKECKFYFSLQDSTYLRGNLARLHFQINLNLFLIVDLLTRHLVPGTNCRSTIITTWTAREPARG